MRCPSSGHGSDERTVGPPARRAPGFSLLEVLVAITILSVAMLPLLSLSSRGVDTTRAERARIAVTLLVDGMLERLASGRCHLELDRLLQPDPTDPSLLSADDVLVAARSDPALVSQLGVDTWAPILLAHETTVQVQLHKRWLASADMVEVHARWVTVRSGHRMSAELHRMRLLVDGGP